MCARQAEHVFNTTVEDKNLASYANHLNEDANKCLVAIFTSREMSGTLWNYEIVSDAFEGVVYASYAWHSDPVKKYWEMPPVECKVKTLAGQAQPCNSNDEFHELVVRNLGLDLR